MGTAGFTSGLQDNRDLYIQGLERLRVRDFSRIVKKRHPGMLHYIFSPKKLALLSSLEEVKPSPDRIMVKLVTFDNLFPPLRHSR